MPLQSGGSRPNEKITGTGKGPVAQISKHFYFFLSPALRDTYQKKYFQVSLYRRWVEGEGVSISWQSMSGLERED